MDRLTPGTPSRKNGRVFRWMVPIALIMVACGREKSAATGESQTPIPPPQGVTGAPIDTVNPHESALDVSGVSALLRNGGLEPRAIGEAREPFSTTPGTLFAVPGAEVEIFIFADAGAAGRATDGFDIHVMGTATERAHWQKPPTIVTNNNMVGVIHANDAKTLDRLRTLLKRKEKVRGQP